MQLYSLEKLHMLRDPATNTKCLVAWGSDTLLISFRGTANRQNATHDVKVSQCHLFCLCCTLQLAAHPAYCGKCIDEMKHVSLEPVATGLQRSRTTRFLL